MSKETNTARLSAIFKEVNPETFNIDNDAEITLQVNGHVITIQKTSIHSGNGCYENECHVFITPTEKVEVDVNLFDRMKVSIEQVKRKKLDEKIIDEINDIVSCKV